MTKYSALISRAIFIAGWLLSPATFWNDAFINLPLSYFCANLLVNLLPFSFLALSIASYWLTNALGILLMYVSGKNILASATNPKREMIKLLVTVVAYSAVLILLDRVGVLKPVRLSF